MEAFPTDNETDKIEKSDFEKLLSSELDSSKQDDRVKENEIQHTEKDYETAIGMKEVKDTSIHDKTNVSYALSKERIYLKCPLCDYKSARPGNLKKHKVNKHNDLDLRETPGNKLEAKFIKSDQDKSFSLEAMRSDKVTTIKKDQRSDDGLERMPGKFFMQSRSKKRKQTKNLLCKLCTFTSACHKNMKNHILNKHEGVRYNCEKCDAKFALEANLKNHIQGIHEGVKYTCDACPYGTIRWNSLKVHIKVHHEGLRFNCQYCDSKFMYKAALKKRVDSIHLGFQVNCDYCDMQFSRIDNLQGHTNSVHLGVLYKCDLNVYPSCEFTAYSKEYVKKIIRKLFTRTIYLIEKIVISTVHHIFSTGNTEIRNNVHKN